MKAIVGGFTALLCLIALPALAKPGGGTGGCSYNNEGKTVCSGPTAATGKLTETAPRYITHRGQRYQRAARVSSLYVASDVTYIPNPPGTWRVAQSCAHRLAAYWGLGKGLDKVSTWARRFQREGAPAVGYAAVRRDQHHILGIVGGGPGAWHVVDFNSGSHKNRAYTVASFGSYFFVDPRAPNSRYAAN